MRFGVYTMAVTVGPAPRPVLLRFLRLGVIFALAFSSWLLSIVVQVFAMGAIRWKTLDIAPGAGRKPQAKWAKRFRGLALPRLT
jgi:hypothetical protein